MANTLKVTLVKSPIGAVPKHKLTVKAMGLTKMHKTGSRNKQNVVLATIEGLRQLKTPEEVARLRGKSVDEILA